MHHEYTTRMMDSLKHGRPVLSFGDDIQMMHYRQDVDSDKANLTLKEHLLCMVLSGRKMIWHPHGKIDVNAGEGFFLGKGNYLRTERRADAVEGYQSLVIRLSEGCLQSMMEIVECAGHYDRMEHYSSGTPDRQAFYLRGDVLVSGLVQQLVQYFQISGEQARIENLLPMKIRELLLLLLTAGVNKGFDVVIKQLPSHREPSLAALMEAHFRESLTLEQWAFLAGMSLSSFKRKFELIYHMPPRRWIQHRRLDEAYRLLAGRRMNVTEVCFEVGFENLAHFVHAFKEKYHITPKQWQREEGVAF
jgi:AraC-like DNA-binding protein